MGILLTLFAITAGRWQKKIITHTRKHFFFFAALHLFGDSDIWNIDKLVGMALVYAIIL